MPASSPCRSGRAFMKRATRGDKPDWFERPANVVGLNVCRVSGKLPAAAATTCRSSTATACIENRSMVYTEYFVRGTQPDRVLPAPQRLRSPNGWPASSARTSGVPVSADDVGLPPPPRARRARRRSRRRPRPSPRTATARRSRSRRRSAASGGRVFGGGDEEKERKKARREARKKEEERRKAERRAGGQTRRAG